MDHDDDVGKGVGDDDGDDDDDDDGWIMMMMLVKVECTSVSRKTPIYFMLSYGIKFDCTLLHCWLSIEFSFHFTCIML